MQTYQNIGGNQQNLLNNQEQYGQNPYKIQDNLNTRAKSLTSEQYSYSSQKPRVEDSRASSYKYRRQEFPISNPKHK